MPFILRETADIYTSTKHYQGLSEGMGADERGAGEREREREILMTP